MPIIIPKDLPAFSSLSSENIFVMDTLRAYSQDIRPIEIAILNLMPTKVETETQLLRLLSNSPLQTNVTFISTATYMPTHISSDHMQKFYNSLDEVCKRKFDGMIITGAPVETMEFEDVAYWDEMVRIMDFADKNVTSTIYICWGAQAALYHFHGIGKKMLNNGKKLSGIFPAKACEANDPLLKGMDDVFMIPHSRYTEANQEEIRACKDIKVLADSAEAGICIAKTLDNKRIYLTGHSEYDRDTLKKEYERDLSRGLDIAPPANYFDKDGKIAVTWRSTANLIFYNWLNYYVYQVTPYDIEKIN